MGHVYTLPALVLRLGKNLQFVWYLAVQIIGKMDKI